VDPSLADKVDDVEHPLAQEKEKGVEDQVVGEEHGFQVGGSEPHRRHRYRSSSQRIGCQ
jgi:hypothetical protein